MIFIELLNFAALLGEVKEPIKESLEYKNQILYHETGLFALLAPVDIVGPDVFEVKLELLRGIAVNLLQRYRPLHGREFMRRTLKRERLM